MFDSRTTGDKQTKGDWDLVTPASQGSKGCLLFPC